MNYSALQHNSRSYDLSSGVVTGSQIFHRCCWLYLIALFILPDGFGIRIGFLFSAKRIMLLVCYAMILFNRERLNKFWSDIKTYTFPNVFIVLYELIHLYTAIYRRDINSITGSVLDEMLVFYLFCYILKWEIEPEKLIRFIRTVLVVLCIEGIWEAITGINLFRFLNFVGEEGWANYSTRGGGSRVAGNCHHAIHFGIYLSILFFLSCVDLKKNRLYLFRSPILFILTTICIFLTGSRAPLGIYIMSIFLICLFSRKDERIKSLIILLCGVSVLAIFTMIVYRTEIGRQIMYMLTAMWDAIFDTEYALNYSDKVLRYSTEYREALAKVFQLDYFNRLVGRGSSYDLSVVIDGYWLRSCDNSYVLTYIAYAYPGVIALILQGLLILGYSIIGLFKNKKLLFAATAVLTICYFINIWFVAQMGTQMYIWMVFALIYFCYKTDKNDNKKEVSR